MTLKELSTILHQLECIKHPGMPTYAVPRKTFTDKTSNGLQNAILAYCKHKGIKAWRQRSEGRYIAERRETNVIGHSIVVQKGQYIPLGKSGGKGAGDIQITLPPHGKSLHIEVKIGRDKQRPAQIEFQRDHEASGGLYWIVKTWDEFFYKMINYQTSNK